MALLNTPKELNGYPVMRVEQHMNCSTVMIDKPGEYVVATWWPALGSSWSWGHSFPEDKFRAATADFNDTATRNARR